MKIGILTYHQAHFRFVQKHNYGAILQAYALKETLRELIKDSDVEVINYIPAIDNDKRYKKYFLRSKIPNSLLLKFKTALFLALQFPKTFKRQRKVKHFISSHLNLSLKVYQEFKENYDYDIFVLGSDQIWNKGILGYFDPVLWGDFKTKDNAKIISYAPSGGIKEFQDKDRVYIKNKLNKLNNISVREESFKLLLQPLSEQDIFITLDPTLLANPNIFTRIAKPPKTNTKYVLIYLLSDNNGDIINLAKHIAKTLNLEIHTITFLDNKWRSHKNIHETCSPQEFLGFFMHAEYVLTNSFHGTAFSLVFQKEFLSFLSNQPKDERIINILTKLDLKHKAVINMEQANNNWKLKTNWSLVTELLSNERKHSKKFLKNAIH
jgi:hypothetical protein